MGSMAVKALPAHGDDSSVLMLCSCSIGLYPAAPNDLRSIIGYLRGGLRFPDQPCGLGDGWQCAWRMLGVAHMHSGTRPMCMTLLADTHTTYAIWCQTQCRIWTLAPIAPHIETKAVSCVFMMELHEPDTYEMMMTHSNDTQ